MTNWIVTIALAVLFTVIGAVYLYYYSLGKREKVTVFYITIMLLMSIGIAVLLVLIYDNTLIQNIKLIFLLSVMWVCAYIDYKWVIIPNKMILYGLSVRGIIFLFELLSDDQIKYILISEVVATAVLLCASFLCLLLIKHSIGAGDIKLFILMGMCLGLSGIWSAIFLSLVVSFIISAYSLLRKKVTRKDSIPFAPSLLIGTILSIILTGV